MNFPLAWRVGDSGCIKADFKKMKSYGTSYKPSLNLILKRGNSSFVHRNLWKHIKVYINSC